MRATFTRTLFLLTFILSFLHYKSQVIYSQAPLARVSAAANPSFSLVSPMCDGASQTITANTGTFAATGYTWTANPLGPYFWTPNAATTTLSIGAPGIFSITLSVSDGTTTVSVTQTVEVNTVPVFTIASTHTLLCAGETATINASGASTYSWSGGPNTATYAVSPSSTTVYTITGATAGNCTNSAQFTQSVTVCTGLAKFSSNKASFSVYPNPVSNQLFFNIRLVETTQTEFEIKDVLGKTIIVQAVRSEAGEFTHSMNTESLKPGIYFVSMRSNNAVQTVKMIRE